VYHICFVDMPVEQEMRGAHHLAAKMLHHDGITGGVIVRMSIACVLFVDGDDVWLSVHRELYR